mgnify:CR=1 FL=1
MCLALRMRLSVQLEFELLPENHELEPEGMHDELEHIDGSHDEFELPIEGNHEFDEELEGNQEFDDELGIQLLELVHELELDEENSEVPSTTPTPMPRMRCFT